MPGKVKASRKSADEGTKKASKKQKIEKEEDDDEEQNEEQDDEEQEEEDDEEEEPIKIHSKEPEPDNVEGEDENLECKDCGEPFVFTVGEQQFYAEKGFDNKPVRCKACKDAKKDRMNGGGGGGRGGGRGGGGGYGDRDRGGGGGGGGVTVTVVAHVALVTREAEEVVGEAEVEAVDVVVEIEIGEVVVAEVLEEVAEESAMHSKKATVIVAAHLWVSLARTPTWRRTVHMFSPTRPDTWKGHSVVAVQLPYG
eukprot:gene11860-24853_t